MCDEYCWKVATSYFYKIRFFKPNMIPISTAKYDPKWYHNNGKIYIDSNGVINGLNFHEFNPGPQLDGLCHGKNSCSMDPSNCEFLKQYRIQLDNIFIEQIVNRLDHLGCLIEEKFKIKYEDIIFVFIVHEDNNNPCSERNSIQEYWNSHGVDCKELEV